MKRKFNMIFGAVFLCMAVISQVLAVTYAPNKNENIIKDNISTLDRVFTQEDIEALFLILEDEEVNKFLPWYPIKRIEKQGNSMRKDT